MHLDKGDEPRPPDVLTRRLVDEAGRLLSSHGPDGLSLRRLAEAVGTSTMTVYTRFGSKQGLLAAMHREGFRRLGAELAASALDGGEPLAALAEIGLAYRRAAIRNQSLYGVMFGPPVPGFEPSPDDRAAAAATYQPLVEGVRRCVDEGQMSGDPQAVALHLWAVAHGMVGLELSGRLPFGPEQAEEAYGRALRWAAAPFLSPS